MSGLERKSAQDQGDTVVTVDGAHKSFRSHGYKGVVVRAVDGVSFSAGAGSTVGVVGESGCGKTTLGRMVAGLVQPTDGTVRVRRGVAGELVDPAKKRGLVQMIYQSSADSLDPRLRVGVSVGEPLLSVTSAKRAELVDRALEAVGMAGVRHRYPHELSGGQQQRVCIARALVAEPSVVVLDEAVSALDILLQIEVLALLQDIQARTRAAFLFISHDLAAVRTVSDYILVMYLGRVVEVIPRPGYNLAPSHPYTVALHSAEFIDGGRTPTRRIVLRGEPPSNVQRHPGCRFAGRCPAARAPCTEVEPELVEIARGHFVACHFPGALGDPSIPSLDSASDE